MKIAPFTVLLSIWPGKLWKCAAAVWIDAKKLLLHGWWPASVWPVLVWLASFFGACCSLYVSLWYVNEETFFPPASVRDGMMAHFSPHCIPFSKIVVVCYGGSNVCTCYHTHSIALSSSQRWCSVEDDYLLIDFWQKVQHDRSAIVQQCDLAALPTALFNTKCLLLL